MQILVMIILSFFYDSYIEYGQQKGQTEQLLMLPKPSLG